LHHPELIETFDAFPLIKCVLSPANICYAKILPIKIKLERKGSFMSTVNLGTGHFPVGIALFIAPLVSTHITMLKAKRAEIASTNKLLSELISRVRETSEKDDQTMIRLLALETTERKVISMRTWPVENPLIGKLALIIAMVAATLIARLIQVLLHI
jgi:hypothetical protein